MTKKLELSLACGDYDILRALKEGIVRPDGIDLTVLTAMDSNTRHWRFLRGGEFDAAEVSCSSYLIARDQGGPFQAIPVFPHRRFRHGFFFINTGKGIKTPADLNGKKVGIKQYQSTAQLWMRGMLEHEHGVLLRSIEWYSEVGETFEFEKPADLKLTLLPEDKSVENMIAEGELDAVIHPDLIKPLVEKDDRVGRLFPDFKNEEIAYYRKTGIFPIMHSIGLRQEIVEKYPWVPVSLYNAFNESKSVAMKRMTNPRIVPLAWYREAWEEQEDILGQDPWEYGMTDKNREQLELLSAYSLEQGMIKETKPLDELYVEVSQGTKRGKEFHF